MVSPRLGRLRPARWPAAVMALTAALLWAQVAVADSTNTRIVGGSTQSVVNRPWQAVLISDDSLPPGQGNQPFCGGAVISPTMILTAAHCLVGTGLSPSDVDVITGRTQLSAAGGERIDAVAANVLPGYNSTTNDNDVGVLQLGGSTVAPGILLAGADERTLWDTLRDPADAAFVAGWGATIEGGAVTDVLREALVRIIPDSICGIPSVYDGDFHAATMVCAGYLSGAIDACEGDSGGPLIVPGRHGAFRHVGVVSFGDGCARPNKPGVYTRVSDDPIRSALRSLVLGLGGPDIVGHGAAFPCNPTIWGTEKKDKLRGTGGPDVIDGLGGKDKVNGLGGRDLLCGDERGDTVKGGAGRDILRGGKGKDVLIGGPGKDKLKGGPGRDRERP